MTRKRLDALRKEWETAGIGPLLYSHLLKLSSQSVKRFPPQALATSGNWDEESLRDASHDLIEALLITNKQHETQLQYCLERAQNDLHFDRLIGIHARRVARGSIRRTVVDNLLKRSGQLLAQDPFVSHSLGKGKVYQLSSSTQAYRDPTEAELRDAATALLGIPRHKAAGESRERAPRVYENADLQRGLILVAQVLPTGFSMTHLRRIFGLVLTSWLPSSLGRDEEEKASIQATTDEDRIIVAQTAEEIVRALDTRQRDVVNRKLCGKSDAAIAREIGIKSRQTVAGIYSSAQELVRSHLTDLAHHQAESILDEVARILLDGSHEGA